MYEYAATVTEVHDGDTLRLDVDLGFATARINRSYRVAGISARELSQPGGHEAQANLAALLPAGSRVTIRSFKIHADPEVVMSLGRYVVIVTLADGRDLAELLMRERWAIAWNGRTKPTPRPPWPR